MNEVWWRSDPVEGMNEIELVRLADRLSPGGDLAGASLYLDANVSARDAELLTQELRRRGVATIVGPGGMIEFEDCEGGQIWAGKIIAMTINE